jgi:hypothetical protein
VIADAIAEGKQKVSVRDFAKQGNGSAPAAATEPAAETTETEPPAESPAEPDATAAEAPVESEPEPVETEVVAPESVQVPVDDQAVEEKTGVPE